MSNVEFRITYREIHETIRGYQEEERGGACPFQAKGTVEDAVEGTTPFYFRYRNGVASVTVYFFAGEYYESMSYGDSMSGAMSADEYATVIANMMPESCVP